MKPVKWGIISTANIGVAKVIPGMLKSKDIEIAAISSRMPPDRRMALGQMLRAELDAFVASTQAGQ